MKYTDLNAEINNESQIYPEPERFREDFASKNEAVLRDILRRNAATEFGEAHGFSRIETKEQYRESVPVSVYSDYRNLVQRMRNGEKALITADPVYCYLETSGSTEAGKLFPITTEALRIYGDVMDRYPAMQSADEAGRRFFLSFLVADTDRKCREEDVMLFTSAYYRFLFEQGNLDIGKISGGRYLNFFPKPCDYLYVKLWLAFADAELTSMESVYLYDFLIFFQYMEDHYLDVLSDMEAGRIPEEKDFPEAVRKALLELPVSEERIRGVHTECEKGFLNIVQRLWKKVRLISGIGSKAFQVEEISIRKYIGELPVWHYIYAASECVMGVPVEPDSYDYVLYPGTAYYEFREADVDDGRILEASELTVGGSYEPILTTFSGLYRYSMGDVLKLKGFYGELPVFRFLHRRNLVMNIAGEKLDMEILDRTVRYWARERKIPVWQYFFCEDYQSVPARYHGVIAPDTGDLSVDEEVEAKHFDRLLRLLSRDYDELRDLGSISEAELSFVDKSTFMQISAGRRQMSGQTKPQHIWRNE